MIGLASEIRIKTFTSGYDQELNINNWLEDNPDLVIVDIKFSSSATTDEWSNEAMVIYRIK